MMYRLLYLLLTLVVVTLAQSGTYKACEERAFCSYLRNKPPTPSEFEVLTPPNIRPIGSSVYIELAQDNGDILLLTVEFVSNEIIRLAIEELDDPTRYYLEKVLDGPVEPNIGLIYWLIPTNYIMIFSGDRMIIVNFNPFSIEINHGGTLVAVVNGEGRLTFDNDETSHAIGFDIEFPLATIGSGLPLHADQVYLRPTGIGEEEPYRLYNIYAESYGSNSTQALSGAVPMLYAHGTAYTAGVFFHNAYETWVDIGYPDGNLAAHFMAEDGILDVFILMGPTPADVYGEYVSLTGITPVPPIWSLGYHHSVTPNEGQTDVEDLVANFDNFEFPIDSVWIWEQTGSFIWNSELYPGAEDMLQNLTSTGRKVVLSVNPFISADTTDPLYIEAASNEYLVLSPERTPYVGDCYLGSCSWWDFTNPAAAEYFESLFSYDQFTGTSATVAGFWSIHNEPLDLNAEENVLPSDNIHYGGCYHKDVHSIYSHFMNEATYEALVKRDDVSRRPFVVTDSFFAGSQRYAAVHTGNNNGTWVDLQNSFHMCVSANLAGIPFCGTDIGGYTGNIDEELLVRWYQTGIWLPLFRSRSRSDRPQLYELSSESQDYIRSAIDLRYSLLEVFYTLFFEHEAFHRPVVRPIFYQYPSVPTNFDIYDEFLVGEDILVYPVTRSNSDLEIVYLPEGVWFDNDSPPFLHTGDGFTLMTIYPDRIPVFYRGGSIIPTKNGRPPSTAATLYNTFSLHIYLDENQLAEGRIYFDDGFSFLYKETKQYYYVSIHFSNEAVTFTDLDPESFYDGYFFQIVEVIIYRPPLLSKAKETTIPITPEVFKTTADGTPIKDIKINANKEFVMNLR